MYLYMTMCLYIEFPVNVLCAVSGMTPNLIQPLFRFVLRLLSPCLFCIMINPKRSGILAGTWWSNFPV